MLASLSQAVFASLVATPIRNRPAEIHKLAALAATPSIAAERSGADTVLGSAGSFWRRDGNQAMERMVSGWNHLTAGEAHAWIANPNIERLYPQVAIKIGHRDVRPSFDAADAAQRVAVKAWQRRLPFCHPLTRVVVRRRRVDLEHQVDPRTQEPLLRSIGILRDDLPAVRMTHEHQAAYADGSVMRASSLVARERRVSVRQPAVIMLIVSSQTPCTMGTSGPTSA